MVESNVTRSPTRQSRTPAPVWAISPAASCPITRGGMRRPVEPSNPCTSLPQMPQARTRTSTSSGPGFRRRHLDQFQPHVVLQQQRIHIDRLYYGVEALPPYRLTCPAGAGILPARALPARLCDPVGSPRLAPSSRLPVGRLPGQRPASLVGPVHLLRPSGPGEHTGGGALSRHAGGGRAGPRLRPRYSAVLARVDRGLCTSRWPASSASCCCARWE